MINIITHDYVVTNNEVWRSSLYQGEIYKLPANQTSLDLVNSVQQLLLETFKVDVFGFSELVNIHSLLSEADFFAGMKCIRRKLFEQQKYNGLLSDFLLSLGFKSGEVAF
ncbi:hypothetical protein [Spartinivicinus ruber]|uniref:hypothetical protein n=1 Tax=Spartinivicinus ruber TaxID=2683272 RepID=UPI0013D6543A|nr:hypothetical protein [Spartinivicinus ruber]